MIPQPLKPAHLTLHPFFLTSTLSLDDLSLNNAMMNVSSYATVAAGTTSVTTTVHRESFSIQTFNAAPSIAQDQQARQGLVDVYEQQSKKNGAAPSIQQLFHAARAACVVEHDKDVVCIRQVE